MPNSINTILNTRETTRFDTTYHDRNLLENAKTKFVHAEYGTKKNLPRNNSTKISFARMTPFDPAVAAVALTEGVTPESQSLKQSFVQAEIQQYGAYVRISDMLKMASFDEVSEASTDLLGEQLGTAIEWVTRDAMCMTNSVQFANGKTARTALTAADKLTTLEIRKAVRTLKKTKAKMFQRKGGKPHFICIVSPDATFDLQDDPLWQDVSKYSAAEQIYNGELGRLFSVVFVESTEAKVYEGAGSGGADVHAALIFGKDAYGIVDIEGSGAIKSIVKELGSSGAEDPLNQRATIGAKVDGYAVTILNDDWIIAIEHGATV